MHRIRYFIIVSIFLVGLVTTGVYANGQHQTGSNQPKTVTLTLMLNHGQANLPLFKKVADDFMKLHPDISINIENIAPSGGSGSNPYYTKLATDIASNTVPDLFYMRGGSGDQKYYYRGIAANLTKYVERDAKQIKLSQFTKSQFLELQYPAGTWRALPYDYSVIGVYYNKQLFDKAGLAYPNDNWTWTTLISDGQKLTKQTSGVTTQYGLANTPLSFPSNFMLGSLWTLGGSMFTKDEKGVLADSPSSIKAFKYLADLATKYHIAPEAGIATNQNPFFTGNAGMSFDGSWATIQYRQDAKFPFDVAMMPKNPTTGKRMVVATGGSFAISKHTRHFKQAWEFLKYLTSDKGEMILIVNPIRSIPPRRPLQQLWAKQISKSGLPPAHAEIFYKEVQDYGLNAPPVFFNWTTPSDNIVKTMLDPNTNVAQAAKEMASQIRANIKSIGMTVSQSQTPYYARFSH